MQTVKEYFVLPSTDLSDSANWRSLGNYNYAVLRARFLVLYTIGDKSTYGPVVNEYHVDPGDELVITHKRQRIITATETISEAIRYTVGSQICDKLAAKLTSEIAIKALGFSGKLGSDILAEKDYQITEQLEKTLTITESHVIQDVEERGQEWKIRGGKVPRDVQTRRRYWPRRWDVYLHSIEYLQLSYARRYWRQIRETIRRTKSEVLGWPLASLMFYEPQSDLDVCAHSSQAESVVSRWDRSASTDHINAEIDRANREGLGSPCEAGISGDERREGGGGGWEKAGSKEAGSKEAGSKKAGSKEAGSKKAGSKKAGSKEAGSKEEVKKRISKMRMTRSGGHNRDLASIRLHKSCLFRGESLSPRVTRTKCRNVTPTPPKFLTWCVILAS